MQINNILTKLLWKLHLSVFYHHFTSCWCFLLCKLKEIWKHLSFGCIDYFFINKCICICNNLYYPLILIRKLAFYLFRRWINNELSKIYPYTFVYFCLFLHSNLPFSINNKQQYFAITNKYSFLFSVNVHIYMYMPQLSFECGKIFMFIYWYLRFKFTTKYVIY